jgi:hypothetical protein
MRADREVPPYETMGAAPFEGEWRSAASTAIACWAGFRAYCRRKPDRDGFVERPNSEGPALEEARQRMFAVRRATKSLELG